MSYRLVDAVWDLPDEAYKIGGGQRIATRQAVLQVICRHAKDDGTGARPGVDRIARLARLDPETVRHALVDLERAGLVRAVAYRNGGREHATQWLVTLPAKPLENPRALDDKHPETSDETPGVSGAKPPETQVETPGKPEGQSVSNRSLNQSVSNASVREDVRDFVDIILSSHLAGPRRFTEAQLVELQVAATPGANLRQEARALVEKSNTGQYSFSTLLGWVRKARPAEPEPVHNDRSSSGCPICKKHGPCACWSPPSEEERRLGLLRLQEAKARLARESASSSQPQEAVS